MKVITESEMNFGKFDETNLFHIEDSKIYKDLGSGIKTVEFILKYDENSIVFLEAKKSCPNAVNRYESEEKEQKFEEYYLSITEKFIASLQIYLATILDKFQNTEEVGSNLKTVNKMREIQLKFIFLQNLGTVPKVLSDQIEEQGDLDVLKKWIGLAFKSKSVEEFVKKIK